MIVTFFNQNKHFVNDQFLKGLKVIFFFLKLFDMRLTTRPQKKEKETKKYDMLCMSFCVLLCCKKVIKTHNVTIFKDPPLKTLLIL